MKFMRTQHYEAKRVNKHLIKPVRLVLKELKFVNKNYNRFLILLLLKAIGCDFCSDLSTWQLMRLTGLINSSSFEGLITKVHNVLKMPWEDFPKLSIVNVVVVNVKLSISTTFRLNCIQNTQNYSLTFFWFVFFAFGLMSI